MGLPDIAFVGLEELELRTFRPVQNCKSKAHFGLCQAIVVAQQTRGSDRMYNADIERECDLLHSKAVTRAAAKRDPVAAHLRSDVLQPALRDELRGLGIDIAVGVLEVR